MPILSGPSPRRAFLRLLSGAAAAALFLLAGRPAPAASGPQDQPPNLPEYVVKAGFLYNFAKYVEWPSDAFEQPDTPIAIGIVGKDPFGDDLEKALKNKTVRNRRFTIARFPRTADIRRCHILFVTREEKEHVGEILSLIREWPVLTVGEEPEFSRSGGTTNILIEKEKPKLEVNPEAAERAKLTINAKLLKVATIVRTVK